MKTKPQKRCPENYELTVGMRSWARETVPGVDMDFECASMKDHEFAKGHTDWDAVMRNWARKAYRDSKRFQPKQEARNDLRAAAEASDMRRLVERRTAIGIPDFRYPHEGESVAAYRAAQDEAWSKNQERRLRLVK